MTFLFFIFAAVTLVCGVGVVLLRSPVSSALAMITSFMGLSALFIQLDAFLVGILQVLVYGGAIMVLFLFIIMLMGVADEKYAVRSVSSYAGAAVVGGGFFILLTSVLGQFAAGKANLKTLKLGEDAPSDVESIGELLFTTYWFPVQIVGVLLLVATVGVVVLSKPEVR